MTQRQTLVVAAAKGACFRNSVCTWHSQWLQIAALLPPGRYLTTTMKRYRQLRKPSGHMVSQMLTRTSALHTAGIHVLASMAVGMVRSAWLVAPSPTNHCHCSHKC